MSTTINHTELVETINEIVETKVRQNIEKIIQCMAESETPDKYSFGINIALEKSDAHLGVAVKLSYAKRFVDEDERLLELVDTNQPELVNREEYRRVLEKRGTMMKRSSATVSVGGAE